MGHNCPGPHLQMPPRSCILAGLGLGRSAPPSELASLNLNNHRGWFCEQGHRGFKGEKGEPGLPGLDGLDAPCPLVWHRPSLPAWPVWASPRVWFLPECSPNTLASSCSTHPVSTSCLSPPETARVTCLGWSLGAPSTLISCTQSWPDVFLAFSCSCLESTSP